MTDAETLSEEQVDYIDKRVKGNEPLRLYLAEFSIDVPALCRTVRALRETYDSLKSKIAWHRDGIGPDVPVLQERYDKLIGDRNALRTGLNNIYHVITDKECDGAVALGMATSAVSALLRENTSLRQQLAQEKALHADAEEDLASALLRNGEVEAVPNFRIRSRNHVEKASDCDPDG